LSLNFRIFCAAATLFVSGLASPSYAIDWSMPQYPHDHFEVRAGGFAHGVGTKERGSADLNAEIIFGKPYWAKFNNSFDILVPRIHTGIMANFAGRTSYAYLGGLWTFDLTRDVFLEGFVGAARHNGQLNGPDPKLADLGCETLFHVGGSLGYRVTEHWSAMVTFDHISNGNAALNACPRNQGLNGYGARIGYTF
jgi:lipid A 3-O-deacylase